MPTISGPLSVVTESPAVVSAVWVQARELRPYGAGAILPQRAAVTLTGSTVSFPCAPGPAVLIWQAGGVEDQVPILVSEESEQTLASVVKAARLAEGRTADELAALVAQVVRDASSASAAAGAAASSAGAAASARDTAVAARDEAVPAAGVATGAASTSTSARDAAVLARNQAEGFAAAASTSATHAADDAASAQLAESGAGTARDQAQALVSQANTALQQALDVIADAESLQDVQTALANVDNRINTAISALVGTAPEHLDTLGELATAVEGLDPALRDLIAERLALADVAVEVVADRVVRRSSTGDVLVPASPAGASSAVARDWVQSQLTQGLSGKANVSHGHTMSQISDLPAVSNSSTSGATIVQRWSNSQITVPSEPVYDTSAVSRNYVNRRKAFFSGDGPPPSSIPGAVEGDIWIDVSDAPRLAFYKIEGV